MTYARSTTLNPNPGGDTTKDAIVNKLDVDLTNAFSYLNAHAAVTSGVHGVAGQIVGTSDIQTLSNKTVTSILTLGRGALKFPAVQISDPNANTLDDYEEGTWMPGLYFGGANVGITYDGLTGGVYTKVGRLVTIGMQILLTNKGSSVGSAIIAPLPFTVANINTAQFAFAIQSDGLTFADVITVSASTAANGMTLGQVLKTTGAWSALTNANFSNSTYIMIGGSYFSD